jgi:ADP-ribose pyrophosphatase YjhB (NUDIX family)
MNDFKTFTAVANKLAYCAIAITVAPTKVIYLQKYPPAGGATVPNLNRKSSSEELTPDTVTKQELIDFWYNTSSYQPSGHWKGGAWAQNNLATTDDGWMTGVFIGDNVNITIMHQGIVKYNKGESFTDAMSIIPGSESSALSVNVEFNGKVYGGYLTDEIMPQRANDVLFIWENGKGEQFIKLLTRGTAKNVDMPKRMRPGAGEHLEPGVDIRVKAGVLRAIDEEIGVSEETLTDAYLLHLGTYDTPGRDPRYWAYSWVKEEDGSPIEFGIKRGSSSQGYVVYLKSETDVAPAEVPPGDTDEVNAKWWASLHSVLNEYPDDRWMIIDHKQFIPHAIAAIEEFKGKSPEAQEACKLSLA